MREKLTNVRILGDPGISPEMHYLRPRSVKISNAHLRAIHPLRSGLNGFSSPILLPSSLKSRAAVLQVTIAIAPRVVATHCFPTLTRR